MADRTDIDALLIGALYGELTPADEARLTAHLESHPADRTALDDLTRTRAAVRDSRILAFQAEPPASVSALLLQEASRRAPRAAPGESWFQRFVRSFAAHPAMAAAATVVLVLGVASLLYVRGVHPFAEAPSPESAAQATAGEAKRDAEKATAGNAPAAPEPPAQAVATPPPASAPGGGAAATGSTAAAGSAGYRVDLDDVSRGQGAVAPAATAGDDQQAKAQPSDAVGGRRAGFEVSGKGDRAELAKAKDEAPSRPVGKLRGIELRRAEPMPKELSDRDEEAALTRERERIAQLNAAANERRATAAPAGAAEAPPPPPPPPAAATPSAEGPRAALAQAPSTPAPNAPAVDAKRPAKSAGNATGNANAVGGARTTRPVEPASPYAGNADKTSNKPAAEKPAASAEPLAWAKKQRDQVVALVNANNCGAAADAAMEIYNRAPGYFSSTILTDREIKPCLVYVNRQRAQIERARAAKNANSVDTETPSRK